MQNNINNNIIIENNTTAINEFFSLENNASKISKFLFNLLSDFTINDPGYTEDFKAEAIGNFEKLYVLVNDIEPLIDSE